MSEILANIVVDQTNINFSPDTNNLNITPEAIQLNIFTGAAPVAGGPNTSVQYSNGGVLEGSADFVFDISNNTVIANLLEVTSEANLGSPSNVVISGGLNGYVLQTDGAGNLSWAAQSGGGGNGSPGGSNTQIQYNDGGVFGGSVGFTFNKVSNAVAIPGNLNVTGGIAGTLTTAAQNNITSIGTLNSLTVTNTVNAGAVTTSFITLNGNLNSNGIISAFFFNGNGNPLFGLNGSNVIGNVANADFATTAGTANTANTATFATTAGTVTTNAQPNITSVGTLSSLSVTGNLSSGNANLGNLATANFFQGDGSLLSNINSANIVGNLSRISNGTSNVNIPTANGNITFNVGGVANIAVISNTAFNTSNLRLNSNTIILGLNTPNTVGPDAIVIGNAAGNTSSGSGSVVIGDRAGTTSDGAQSVAIGQFARQNGVGNLNVSIGWGAGRNSSGFRQTFVGHNSGSASASSGLGAVGVGYGTLANGAGSYQIAIGHLAGANGSSDGGIAIGKQAGLDNQGDHAIAIGQDVAGLNQGQGAIAIGFDAGGFNQGIQSIAIGEKAGFGQANNTIILNATGTTVSASTANTLVVRPIRQTNDLSLSLLDYNTTTGEISSHVRTFGSFTSNATQTSNGANTTNYVTLNNTEDANGISIVSNTRVTVARIGRYNIQFSAQVEKTDSGSDIIEIWLDKNGTAVPNSATQLTLAGNNAKEVAAWDFNVNAANVNDYFRLAWASPDTDVRLTAIPSANTISGVAVPSVIFDINPIGA